jgi:PQQ-like domain
MRKLLSLTILGCLLITWQPGRTTAAVTSDWPSLNYDAAQSNFNRVEKTVSAKNVLKLKVQWTSPIPAGVSYAVVAAGKVFLPTLANGKVHVRECDAVTGKYMAKYTKDAYGGTLADNGNLYVAGKYLQQIDPATGQVLGRVDATPSTATTSFVDPLADGKLILAGYADGVNSRIYTVDPASNQILRQLPSVSARGAALTGRVVTNITTGSALYDEASGKALARQPYFGSFWFAGSNLMYTVASVKKQGSVLYAVDGTARKVWSRSVGPTLATSRSEWPHAISPTTLYVQTYKPQVSVVAVDALTGNAMWTQPVQYIQRIVLANDVLLVLTYALGQPVKVVALRPDTGKVLGAIVLSGVYAFPEQNELMVADGMVFIRVASNKGSLLLALGLGQVSTAHCGF